MAAPIKNNPYDADNHLRYFAEFCQGVAWTGGTTPHMLLTVRAGEGLDRWEKLWRAGCYGFVYNEPTAEILWNRWKPGVWKRDELIEWARTNWKGVKFRKERKAARSPERLTDCMTTYSSYMEIIPTREWFKSKHMDPKERYFAAFDDICENVKYFGRYITIRLIETYRRMFNLDMPMPDLRPVEGDHPRKALALMYPEYMKELMGGNSDGEIEVVNAVVEMCRDDMKRLYKLDVDYYEMQSLLCEYKQSVLAAHQYPSKSIDSFLAYFYKVYEYWGDDMARKSELFKFRKNVFPEWVLGEIQGWNNVREELNRTLIDYGYTWSDRLYDYNATRITGDFSNPVKRSGYATQGDPWFRGI